MMAILTSQDGFMVSRRSIRLKRILLLLLLLVAVVV
jgi:hypothetical protein